MQNKKRNNPGQLLSPENYIRQRARTLPIYECLINKIWKESKMAQLSIARKHSNGNITVCIYLIDLMCLGIKDTHFLFNVPLHEYEDKMGQIDEAGDLEIIDYVLAHNIIFAGIEFAGDYGFRPHKDFTSVTLFMLEEDTEEIELLEIECGLNGMPAYMPGPYDDRAKKNKIISQLEKTAGTGNYTYLDQDDDMF
jgi:hypothetical protein